MKLRNYIINYSNILTKFFLKVSSKYISYATIFHAKHHRKNSKKETLDCTNHAQLFENKTSAKDNFNPIGSFNNCIFKFYQSVLIKFLSYATNFSCKNSQKKQKQKGSLKTAHIMLNLSAKISCSKWQNSTNCTLMSFLIRSNLTA